MSSDGLRHSDAADERTWEETDEIVEIEVKEPLDTPVGRTAEPSRTLLFSEEQTQRFRAEWDEVQIGFVDQPRAAVERADGLVAQVIKRLAEVFADERTKLEHQWSRGDQVSTEDLRVALQRYRSFFGRLLSV